MLKQFASVVQAFLVVTAAFVIHPMSQVEARAAHIGVVASNSPRRELLAYESVMNELLRMCHTVDRLTPGDLRDVSDYGGIILTPSMTPSTDVENFLRDNPSSPMPVPVIIWNSALWDEFQFGTVDGAVMSSPNGITLISAAPAGIANTLLLSLPPHMTLGADNQVDIRPWANLQFGPRAADVIPASSGGANVIGSKAGGSRAAVAVNDPAVGPPMRIALPFSSDALRFAPRSGYQLFGKAVDRAFGIVAPCGNRSDPPARPHALIPGDANLDGVFCSADLVVMFNKAKFETGLPATWMEGDFDGNGSFESGDLVAAFVAGAFSTSCTPAPAIEVPEPGTIPQATVFCLACFLLLKRPRRIGTSWWGTS